MLLISPEVFRCKVDLVVVVTRPVVEIVWQSESHRQLNTKELVLRVQVLIDIKRRRCHEVLVEPPKVAMFQLVGQIRVHQGELALQMRQLLLRTH